MEFLYERMHKYTTGVSEPNPYSSLDWKKVTDLKAPVDHDFPPGYLTCPNFFSSMNEAVFNSENAPIDWKYTQRRDAQMIFPFLYVGPVSAAKDLEFLKKEGITLLLAVRKRHPAFATILNGEKSARVLGIEADAIEVGDNFELTGKLPSAIKRINDHLCNCGSHENQITSGLKKVLLFCESGNDQSAAVAMAYLMGMLNFDPETATVNIQARRFSAIVSNALINALTAFDSILNANRAVTRSRQLEPPQIPQMRSSRSPSKRPRSPSDESMDGVGDNMDQQRYNNISPPFQDV